MQIYFGAEDINSEDLDSTDMFISKSTDDKVFYYCVEYGSNPGGLEDFTIMDTASRSIPISVDHIDELITALTYVKRINDLTSFADKVEQDVIDPFFETHVD